MTSGKPAPLAPKATITSTQRAVVHSVEDDAITAGAPIASPALVSMDVEDYGYGPVQRRAVPDGIAASGHYARSPIQRKIAPAGMPAAIGRSSATAAPTRLPLNLRAGLESLSGLSLNHVRVHYNSLQPARLNALAYAQGGDIHLAQGQERHLAHEAWHVVQQHQGRVRGTSRQGSVALNGDAALEREADVMGTRAEHLSAAQSMPVNALVSPVADASTGMAGTVQRKVGQKADGERVVERDDPETVYIARRNGIGTYDLFDEETGTFHIDIAPDDDDYILYDDIDEELGSDSDLDSFSGSDTDGSEADDESEDDDTPFSIISDQAKRRVYTSGPTRGKGGFKALIRSGKKDFSYGEVSRVFHDARKRVRRRKAVDRAITTGVDFPLEDGEIPLDEEQDADLQLVPFHLRAYQKFHTPPELKSAKRKRENPWRQEELDNTGAWLKLPDAQGLDLILPRNPSTLREYYPGPIDVSFPPGENELFTYAENKAIYKINREVLLKAYLNGEDEGQPKSKRARLTGAFFDVVGTQDDSVAKGREEEYVRRTFGLKRTESESSLDEASSEDDVEQFDLSESDAPVLRARKRKTYLNTLGLLVKLYNRKILEDLRAIVAADDDEMAQQQAEESLEKHRRLLDKLEDKYGDMVKAYAETFKEISGTITYVKQKTKLLQNIKPEGEQEQLLKQRYVEALEEFLAAESTGERRSRPLEGIGKGTFESRLSGVSGTGSKAREKRRDKRLRELANQYGGTLKYGSGDGNNCLIFAIANAVGHDITEEGADEIREALYQGDHAGVDRDGYLPATTRVVDIITQFVLAELDEQVDEELPNVTVHILTVIPDIAPVVVGDNDDDDAQVYVIHDGGHYWWLKR